MAAAGPISGTRLESGRRIQFSRRNFRIALLAFVAASLVVILPALEHQISHRRWPVESLSDPDSGRVVRLPVDTTVRALASLPKVPAPSRTTDASRPTS